MILLNIRILLISLLFFPSCNNDKPQKILFLGDSITYAGDYITFIETYYHLKYPEENIEFINAGLPSETVSGLSEPGHADNKFPRPDLFERLDRVMELINPDIVYACYGMNDGIYLPFDSSRFRSYKEGIIKLHDKIKKNDAEIFHITPPIFDERRGNIEGYAEVLDIYSNWLLKRKGWNLIDLHFPMKEYLEDKRNADSSFALATDGVHPGKEGHWLMAKSLLSYIQKQQITDTSFESFINRFPKGKMIYELVDKKQHILKDAYLTKSGHKRPEMDAGVPFVDALKYADSINSIIVSQR